MKCRQARCGVASIRGIIGLTAIILVSVSAVSCDWLSGSKAAAYVAGYYGNGKSTS